MTSLLLPLCMALCCWSTAGPAHGQASPKKVIATGWDSPTTAQFRRDLATMGNLPLDGTSLWAGEPTSAPAIAPARSPPLEMKIGQELAAPEAVFEAIPELEFDQTANLRAEAGHDRLLHNAGVEAEPIPELEFDQTLG